MRPLRQLPRRIHRLLILLMSHTHSLSMLLQRVRRQPLVDFIRDADFAREFDVVVLNGLVSAKSPGEKKGGIETDR